MKLDIVFQKPFFPVYDVVYCFPDDENTTGEDEDPDGDDKPVPGRPGGNN